MCTGAARCRRHYGDGMTYAAARKRLNIWHYLVLALAGAFLVFILSQDALARLAWHRYGQAGIAIALNRRDAEFAMRLGNYYPVVLFLCRKITELLK